MEREELNTLLKKANLSKKEFASILGIEYTSMNNWGSSQNIPYWVSSWLENYIDKKRFDTIKQVIKDSELQ